MFFESRYYNLNISRSFRSCARLYKKGQVIAAYEKYIELRNAKQNLIAEDVLLCSDIAMSCGRVRQAEALVKLGHKTYPENLLLKLRWYMISSRKSGLLDVIKNLDSYQGDAHRQLVFAMMALFYSRWGMEQKARSFMRKCDDAEDPVINYLLCSASANMRYWDDAVSYGKKAYAVAQQWPELRIVLVYCLLAVGKVEESAVYVEEGIKDPVEDAWWDYFCAMHAYSMGKLDLAIRRVQSHMAKWIGFHRLENMQIFLLIMQWFSGNIEESKKMASILGGDWQARLNSVEKVGRQKMITTPVICQEPLMCVPTSVAICAGVQGVTLDPRELFSAMKGSFGTELWRMCDEMLTQGFTTLFIAAKHRSVQGMLDQGIPLIAQSETLFNSHVEVITGYDATLGIYIVRDPMEWAPYVVNEHEFMDRYTSSGSFFFALVTREKQLSINVQADWVSESGKDLIGLQKACAMGKQVQAESLFLHIPKNESVYQAACDSALGVTITPKQYSNAMKTIVPVKEFGGLCRVRALVQSGDKNLIDEWLDKLIIELELNSFYRDYLNLFRLFADQLWQPALDLVEKLIHYYPSIDHLWIKRAEALLEMGMLVAAKESSDIAFQLSPKSVVVRSKIRALFPYGQVFQDQLQEINELIKRNPSYSELVEEKALILFNGQSGLEFEAALKECQRLLPRKPVNYQRLSHWYLQQQREDLAKNNLQHGRELIPLEELPYWDFEDSNESMVLPEKFQELTDVQKLLNKVREDIFLRNRHDPQQFTRLCELDAAGNLHWYESIELLALQMHVAIRANLGETRLKLMQTLLPKELPGTLAFSLTYLLSLLRDQGLQKDVANFLFGWAVKQLETVDWREDLAFELALLLEFAGKLQAAEEKYQEICQRAPGYSGAYYRLGILREKRGDVHGAVESYKNSIDIQPNSPGSIIQLIKLYHRSSDGDNVILWQKKICKLEPYAFDHIEQLIKMVHHYKGKEAAEMEFEEYRSYLLPEARTVIKAQLYIYELRFDEAQMLLDEDDSWKNKYQRQGLLIEIECAQEQGRHADAVILANCGLQENPDDQWLVQVKGISLEKESPQKAKLFYQEKIQAGFLDQEFIIRYIGLLGKELNQIYVDIEKLGDLNKERFISALHYAMGQLGLHEGRYQLLKYCEQHFPQYHAMREALVYYYMSTGELKKAEQTANTLFNDDGQSAVWYALLAHVYQYNEPKKAIEYFKKDFEMTGSVESLAYLGRCYQTLGELDLAKSYYFQVLQKDRIHDLAINNLVMMGLDPSQFYQQFCDGLEQGYGIQLQYYHVNAVIAARSCNGLLPEQWFWGAQARFESLLQEPPFLDEKERLAKALFKWLQYSGYQEQAERYRPYFSPQWLKPKLWFWPGDCWIMRVHLDL